MSDGRIIMKKNMDLKYTQMGFSDLVISNIGLGGQAISGRFCNNDDCDSLRTMHRAVEEGINWLHTAPSYGTGYGEIMISRFLKECDPALKPYIFTTVTWVFDKEDEGNDKAVRVKSLMPESIRKQVEGSLRRLGVDYIDLIQFHWPDYNTPIEESWETMKKLKKEGKVRSIGLSNHPIELIKRCQNIEHVDCLQQPLSLVDRSMNGPYYSDGRDSGGLKVLEWAKKNNSSIISFAPLQHGVLAGKYTKVMWSTLSGH
jgi:aryl-alcohol dehydrogenase-like predicted oxidoreductase